MSIRVALHHKTTYQYDRQISLGPQTIRLRPAPHSRTPITGYSLKVTPANHFINWQQDPQGNYLARLVFPEKTDLLEIQVDLIAQMTVINPFDFFLEPSAEKSPFKYEPWLEEELKPFLVTLPLGPKLEAFLATIDKRTQPTNDYLVMLNTMLNQHIKYLLRMEPGVQTCEETLTLKSGSCRDSAWLLVQIMRRLGVAARFVSGYLIQLKADEKSLDGPSGTAVDFTDLHAWTEVYLPGAGWIGLDPTSGLFAGEGHIPLAATPDPVSAAPISGATDPCETEFDVQMTVTRIHETPRVTLPYTEAQWTAIDKLGSEIDTRLKHNDVRLTIGGEPTFVSVDDMEGAEWNFTAMGPDKRRLAGDLFTRMRDKFSKGALLHYGQGKWYPGESLPRWALGCYWRLDGKPIWRNPNLIAGDSAKTSHDITHAKQFAEALTKRLGLASRFLLAAYEDPWRYLMTEGKLPVNVDPLSNKLANPEERERLRRVFDRGLNTPAGYVLPIQPHEGEQAAITWQSSPWPLRTGQIHLVPGDSPIGLRLPLADLPWTAPDAPKALHEYPPDPMDPREPLSKTLDEPAGIANSAPDANPVTNTTAKTTGKSAGTSAGTSAGKTAAKSASKAITPASASKSASQATQAQAQSQSLKDTDKNAELGHPIVQGESAKGIIHTALCIEARAGRLHVFMPPVRTLEQYLKLIATIEDTAQELNLPVAIEGYTPPHDSRLSHFKVTPDPGVIEVNIQPASSWPELVNITTTIYNEARQCRLGTEKFMLDGRHSGTGGGNHIVLGGPTPADSPFLRRPDLLKSLLGYWLNHPALSYLFSGLFLGPTSQAPRVDEARHDNVYELETAFDQIPNPLIQNAWYCPPWLVDRVFRHLLTDLTGNTHRAEFCIDKLYAPETSTGRLGLLELRGFEMPPHARMSLAQQLLIRGLIAKFWDQPYNEKLIHWGTRLHDQFMLPHFVAEDLDDVIDDLNRAGLAFNRDWFAAHMEFRFPLIGQMSQGTIHLELNTAIEPWNVLGEEPGANSTARYVDSSLERLQVKVEGLVDDRHIITCNGRRLPLHPTGVHGQYVAGVRYRAWQPPSCLHPTIPVHAPLVFDIIDTWSKHAIGGCTYHVVHPGGRSYETFPVNALEAESRRANRFFATGHTPGQTELPPVETNRLYPFTLDLRRRKPMA